VALKIFVALLVAVLVGGIAFGFYRTIPPADTAAPAPTMATSTISTAVIGNTAVQVEVEDTDASREQGLSGRTSLAEGSGMLFVFDSPGKYGFWMKDMNFAIDMLFMDASGKIVTIAADASPAGYHLNPPQVFYPASPVMYVLEVPAGFAAGHGIAEGQTVTFK
jgi:uncharacterized membrane protein (UPF0127 family)